MTKFTINILTNKIRLGRIAIPVWLIILATALIAAAAGQTGAVLKSSTAGAVGLTVERNILVAGPPSVVNAHDGLGTVNDEGTMFTIGLETHVGRVQTATLSLANTTEVQVDTTLEVGAAGPFKTDFDDCFGMNEARSKKNKWLLNIAPGNTWETDVVDELVDDDVGFGTDLQALDGCHIFVSYRKQAGPSHRVEFARTYDGGKTWFTQIVDEWPDDVAGFNTSPVVLDVDTIFVAYRKRVGIYYRLEFARSDDGGDTWTTHIVDAPAADHAGYDSSMVALDPDTILISYRKKIGGLFQLASAKSIDGGVSWSPQTIDSAVDRSIGYDTSIAALNPKTIFISYRDTLNGGQLKIARSLDGGDSWAPGTVHASPVSRVGFDTSIAAIFPATVMISYRDSFNGGTLRLATSVNAGNNFLIITVDEPGVLQPTHLDIGLGAGYDTSITAPDARTIMISYRKAEDHYRLKIAKSVDSGGTWTIATADDGTSDQAGRDTAIVAIDSTLALISHRARTGSFYHLEVAKTGSAGKLTIKPDAGFMPGFFLFQGQIGDNPGSDSDSLLSNGGMAFTSRGQEAALIGSVGIRVGQAINATYSEVTNVKDGLATAFKLAIETQVGRPAIVDVNVSNSSGTPANALLSLKVPQGVVIDVVDGQGVSEVRIGPNLWLLSIGPGGGSLELTIKVRDGAEVGYYVIRGRLDGRGLALLQF